MLVQELLEASARRLPDKVALVVGDRRVSYRFLDDAANRFAAALRSAGFQRGERVAILLDTSVETVVSIFGTLKAAGVFVVLHPSTKPDKLVKLLVDAEPSVLVTDHARAPVVARLLESVPSVRTVVWRDTTCDVGARIQNIAWSELENYSSQAVPCASIDVDLATLIYTSGSTGQAKGVMSTHRNIVAATDSINSYVGNEESSIILNVLPLSFDYGLYQLFLAFQVGARIVLERGFAFPAQFLDVIVREGVSGLPAVPTLIALLLKYPSLLQRQLPSLKYITNTAAALPVSHILRLREHFPNVRIISMYGLTECKRVSFLPPPELDRRPDSVGIAIPNTEAYIVGDDGRRVAPGEEGELVVRGAHVTRGYWRAPELTAEKFRPGELEGETVLYTGDVFRADAEGYLYFVRRKDDVIKTGGQKVSPREIEETLCHLEGVAEVAVLGVPDPILGEAILLVVAPRAGAALAQRTIRTHCRQTLDDYMQPKYIDIVRELPRTDNGKVDKRRIWAEVASSLPVAASSNSILATEDNR